MENNNNNYCSTPAPNHNNSKTNAEQSYFWFPEAPGAGIRVQLQKCGEVFTTFPSAVCVLRVTVKLMCAPLRPLLLITDMSG